MANWNLVDVIRSRHDATVKYVFESGGKVIELSYIDKNDGKHIICAPTQSSCRLGCRFCHLTGLDIPVVNLTHEDLGQTIRTVIGDLDLVDRVASCPTLLISFMGCGEPLLNVDNVIETSLNLRANFEYPGLYSLVRYAVATLIPNERNMREFTARVARSRLKVKLHWSLHTPNESVRRVLMPSARPLAVGVELVTDYVRLTGNAAEAHYALIAGDNDTDDDAASLVELLKGRPINVKILRYNEKPGEPMLPSHRVQAFRDILEASGIATEYYEPPGSDIGSSCGQFLTDYYKKYAPKKT